MKRVTLRDIAESIGVHHSTVSRALKNDHRLPEDTRQRVLRAAAELNYRPDPMLSALMAYRSENQKKTYQSTLAWVTNYPTRDGWRQYEKIASFRGANHRAAELGYTIEPFWLHEPGLTMRRATQILLNRNIQGLLVVQQPRSRAHLNLNWDNFSAVSFGRTLARPRLQNVDTDHYSSMANLMRHLKSLGYRRIALAVEPRIHESVNRAWMAAYWSFQKLPPRKQIPPFLEKPPWQRESFFKWVNKHRPDAVVSHLDLPYHWMKEMGLRIPQEIGFAMAAKPEEFSAHYSGMDENIELVGATAVDVLVQMIHRGEKGIPKIPASTLVEGAWVQGETLRKVYV